MKTKLQREAWKKPFVDASVPNVPNVINLGKGWRAGLSVNL